MSNCERCCAHLGEQVVVASSSDSIVVPDFSSAGHVLPFRRMCAACLTILEQSEESSAQFQCNLCHANFSDIHKLKGHATDHELSKFCDFKRCWELYNRTKKHVHKVNYYKVGKLWLRKSYAFPKQPEE